MTTRALAVLLAFALGGCAIHAAPVAPVEARVSSVHDLAALGDLAAAFDRDRAHPRLVLLLSPT